MYVLSSIKCSVPWWVHPLWFGGGIYRTIISLPRYSRKNKIAWVVGCCGPKLISVFFIFFSGWCLETWGFQGTKIRLLAHWVVTPCSNVGCEEFGGPCCLLLQSEVNEYGGSMILRNVGILPHHYMASQPTAPRRELPALFPMYAPLVQMLF